MESTVGNKPKYITLIFTSRGAASISVYIPGKKISIHTVLDKIVYIVNGKKPYFFK